MNDEMEAVNWLDNDAIVIEPEDSAAALEKWQTARRIAEEHLRKTSTPEWSYIAGYLCYMLFSRGACSFAIVEKYLLNGLAPGPKEGLARFYLASLYFDTDKFVRAIQHLERIAKAGKDYFKKMDQEWRYAKSMEMLVAAHIRSGAWFEAISLGSQMDAVYRECGDYESMIPLALIGALEDADSQDSAYEELCRIAAGLVQLTHSERAVRRLFHDFSWRWLPAFDE